MAGATFSDSALLFLVIFILVLISKVEGNAAQARDLKDLLSLKAKLKGLVLDDEVEFDDASDTDSGFDDFESSLEVKPALNEKDSYLLYNLFKATQDQVDLDKKANEKFEDTKSLLSGALRSRCGRLERCLSNCYSLRAGAGCEFNCQKVFDSLNACTTTTNCPTTCKTKKTTKCGRGRTMPPKWLLRMLAQVPVKK